MIAPALSPKVFRYALEQLYVDQNRGLVIETVPFVLAWVPKSKDPGGPPYRFEVEHGALANGSIEIIYIDLSWDIDALERHDSQLQEKLGRCRTGQSIHREHVQECAGYGLAFVAISVLMPGRRVLTMRRGFTPDVLLDVTPGQLRGVEVAARSFGGRGALHVARKGTPGNPRSGKQRQLLARADVAEAHLSLWSASPRVAEMVKVKP